MSAIDDLINQISNKDLRNRIKQETDKIKNSKKFGLVFEEHLPECTPLYDVKIKVGSKVAIKDKNISDMFIVMQINGSNITCENIKTHEIKTVKLSQLVCVAEFGEPIYPYLKGVDSIENAPQSDLWHVLIQADNYHALQFLRYVNYQSFDCIYIDPPYNTGAKDWKYNNYYVDGNDKYRHSKWLSFMEKRLKLAKKLLNPKTGVIVVTIDDYEVQRLTMLMDEIFGEKAHLGTIVIKNNPQGRSMPNGLQVSHEYALFYGMPKAVIGDLDRNINQLSRYNQHDNFGPFEWRNFRAQYSKNSARLIYPIYVKKDASDFRIPKLKWNDLDKKYEELEEPKDDEIKTMPFNDKGQLKTWKWSIKTVLDKKNTDMGVRLDRHKRPAVYFKGRMKNEGMKPFTVWDQPQYSASTFGANLLEDIIGVKKFNYPKSIYAVADCVRVATNNKKDAKVLDFFAGSGTTMHAVNLLNAQDDGKRQCILITNNEVSNEEESQLLKQGFNPGDSEWEKKGIAEYVTWPRIKYSILGKNIHGKALTGNYNPVHDDYLPVGTKKVIINGVEKRKKIYIKNTVPDYPNKKIINKSDGFKANVEYFKLGFLDKNTIALGMQFKKLLSTLWMKSGSIGKCPSVDKISDYLIFPENKFAVLLNEKAYSSLKTKLLQMKNINTLYIVTDSDDGYREMISQLNIKNTYQLYKDYLDNFRINTKE